MKKMTALFLSLLLVLTMTAALAETDITLWTFPIGDWGNSEKVDEMLAAFNAVHPDIKVTVEYLDYTNGDAQITTAIEAKTTPVSYTHLDVYKRQTIYRPIQLNMMAVMTSLMFRYALKMPGSAPQTAPNTIAASRHRYHGHCSTMAQ